MRKVIVLLLLFCTVFLVACDNASLESEDPSSSNISSSAETFNYDENNETSGLKEISVLSGKAALLVPITFEIMSEEMAEIKYPSENRPTVIYTNERGTINIAFNHTDSKVSYHKITDYMDMLTETLTNHFPSAQWYKSDIEVINGSDVGVFELITPAIDTDIYNLMWITDLDKRLLIVTFNCTTEEMAEWEPTAKIILQSFKIK